MVSGTLNTAGTTIRIVGNTLASNNSASAAMLTANRSSSALNLIASSSVTCEDVFGVTINTAFLPISDKNEALMLRYNIEP